MPEMENPAGNPKSETRMTHQIRSPKPETDVVSDFWFRARFVILVSDFGFQFSASDKPRDLR